MYETSEVSVNYDRAGDVLYIMKHGDRSLRSSHGDPGLVWRFDRVTGEALGVTVMGFSAYWLLRVDDLARQISAHLALPEKDAHSILRGVQRTLQ